MGCCVSQPESKRIACALSSTKKDKDVSVGDLSTAGGVSHNTTQAANVYRLEDALGLDTPEHMKSVVSEGYAIEEPSAMKMQQRLVIGRLKAELNNNGDGAAMNPSSGGDESTVVSEVSAVFGMNYHSSNATSNNNMTPITLQNNSPRGKHPLATTPLPLRRITSSSKMMAASLRSGKLVLPKLPVPSPTASNVVSSNNNKSKAKVQEWLVDTKEVTLDGIFFPVD